VELAVQMLGKPDRVRCGDQHDMPADAALRLQSLQAPAQMMRGELPRRFIGMQAGLDIGLGPRSLLPEMQEGDGEALTGGFAADGFLLDAHQIAPAVSALRWRRKRRSASLKRPAKLKVSAK